MTLKRPNMLCWRCVPRTCMTRWLIRLKITQTPPVDTRVSASWNVVGYITAIDALLDAQMLGLGTRFFYGFVASSKADPTQFVAVIRGTENASEWMEDIEFAPMPAPAGLAGQVENGFFSIYKSMQFTKDGTNAQPVVEGVAGAIGANKLTVLGHSLGSPLATYLTLDLALTGQITSLSACMFASPHAGDNAFAQFFDLKVGAANYKVYNYSRDIVPKVPFMFDYTPLPQALEFQPADAQAVIQNTLSGNHHAVCYAAMINYSAATWTSVPPIDQACAACITGPNPPAP